MASIKVIIYDPTGSKKTPVELPGDVPMRRYAADLERPTLCLLLRHDDAEREVEFDAGADKAVAALNGTELDGRAIKVDVAQAKNRNRDGGRW